MRFALTGLAAVFVLAGACNATAAVITQKITFTAYGFSAYSGPTPAPVDPVTGTFVVRYDPLVDNDPTATGLQVLSLNLPDPGSRFAYDYIAAVDEGSLFIGTKPSVGGGFAINEIGDYGVVIDNVRHNPRMGYAQYMTSGGNYFTLTGTVSLATVPEPKTWALLIGGFGLAGGALRSNRRRTSRV